MNERKGFVLAVLKRVTAEESDEVEEEFNYLLPYLTLGTTGRMKRR